MNEIRKNEPSLKDNVITYLKGVRTEWDKVTWPDKRQITVETFIVIGVVFFFTALVFIYDVLFEFVFRLIPGG
ncbi:MAG TPA: preprotein translocase subunit SecE [Candidatus Gastranaerophilales bacterium]|nr:preprotein translocase subunit SecE [Candidatus Gastranaerophilales bacterium]